MRIVKAPRATWEMCGHMLVISLGAALLVAAFCFAITAIWTGSGRFGWTAATCALPGVIVLFGGGVTHSDSGCRTSRYSVPLPWRRRVEDEVAR